ncbi:hypothetical protein B7R21_19305 [Subtercola boreus]|uniref:SHOCT domain-containing protein n=2 Tax=Subtercola boreus TaxID=120213 RepID=A0A3E0VAR9_9MICO|nr:PH domain-containing protein [Subtercola boreus]RFA06623.1 hypothetical protein B7R21_19305 [Subtercola boreus]
MLIATDRRIVFFDKKFVGYKMESYPYGTVSSFDQSGGMTGASITFYSSGNVVGVKAIHDRDDLAAFTASVRENMSQTTAPSAVAPGPSSNDIFDQLRQLRQLGQLRDAGIITPGEFETKKAEMLARL